MAWPRKGTRSIVVDGETFAWHIPSGRVGWADDRVTVGRAGSPHVLHLDPLSWDGVPRPSMIAAAIRWATSKGWSPEQGPTRNAAFAKRHDRFVFLPDGVSRLQTPGQRVLAEFEIEDVLADGMVFAAQLGNTDFELSPQVTLGGLPIRPHLSQPRAIAPDGVPRFDLFAFEPIDRHQARRLRTGDFVVLATT